jgi:hypothetical protein
MVTAPQASAVDDGLRPAMCGCVASEVALQHGRNAGKGDSEVIEVALRCDFSLDLLDRTGANRLAEDRALGLGVERRT